MSAYIVVQKHPYYALTDEQGLFQLKDVPPGEYELEFDIGRYFRDAGIELSDPPFLGTVVLRFSVRSDEHYHVPLLVSPWSYSTYRGS